MNPKSIITLILIGCFQLNQLVTAHDFTAQFEGLKGDEIYKQIKQDYCPINYPSTYTGENGIYSLIFQSDGNHTGYLNRFDKESLTHPHSFNYGIDNLEMITVIDSNWWLSSHSNYYLVGKDLYNILPAPIGTDKLKETYVPGNVEQSHYENIWKTGIGIIDGKQRYVWELSPEYRGDIARIVFYMLTIYSDGIPPIGSNAYPYICRPSHLGINESALGILLQWHREDAVSEVEIKRNEIFSQYQGNRNPYVDSPEILEYIWGAMRDEVFNHISDSPNDGTEPEEKQIPLKSEYSKQTDKYIFFTSPLLPQDVVFEFDGQTITNNKLPLENVDEGIHEIMFGNNLIQGKLKVKISQ